MEGYARIHRIPMLRVEKGGSEEDAVRPHLERMERRNQHGVYGIFTSMEMGSMFTSKMPKYPSVLEKLDHGHHVLRIYCKNLVGRMYEKFSTFLRVEVCVNRMKDLGRNKGLKNLECLRQRLVTITDRFAGFEAQSRNVHVDFPLFQRMALPITFGQTKIAGIKIHDTRMLRLMEVLLHDGTQLKGWRSADIHQAILTAFGLSATAYTLTQLRYDLRKMKAHGLLADTIAQATCKAGLVRGPATGNVNANKALDEPRKRRLRWNRPWN